MISVNSAKSLHWQLSIFSPKPNLWLWKICEIQLIKRADNSERKFLSYKDPTTSSDSDEHRGHTQLSKCPKLYLKMDFGIICIDVTDQRCPRYALLINFHLQTRLNQYARENVTLPYMGSGGSRGFRWLWGLSFPCWWVCQSSRDGCVILFPFLK